MFNFPLPDVITVFLDNYSADIARRLNCHKRFENILIQNNTVESLSKSTQKAVHFWSVLFYSVVYPSQTYTLLNSNWQGTKPYLCMRARCFSLPPKSRYHIFVELEIYGDDIYLKTAKSSSAQLLMILAFTPFLHQPVPLEARILLLTWPVIMSCYMPFRKQYFFFSVRELWRRHRARKNKSPNKFWYLPRRYDVSESKRIGFFYF